MAEAKGFDLSEAKDESRFLSFCETKMAEARGFEPPRPARAHTISSRAPSTTRPRFRELF